MPSVIIRNATAHDGDAITSLFRTVFNKEMSVTQWRWKYRLPHPSGLYSSVAVSSEGEIVGHVGAIPLTGSDRGKGLPAYQLADAMVRSDYRGQNLFQELLQHVGRSVDSVYPDAICYAFAGPDSTRIGIKKTILHDLGSVPCCLLDAARTPSPGFGWSMTDTSFSDSRLERLWRGNTKGVASFAVRDGAFIEWRYAANPCHRYRVSLLRHFFRPVGWCVWTGDEEGIRLIDLCIGATHVDAALSLFAQAYASGRKVRFWLPDHIIRRIKLPLTTEETLIHLMLLNHRTDGGLPAGADKALFFTMGDVDIY